MSSSVHVDDKVKDILILGKGPTQGLDETTLTAEARYPNCFKQSGKRFALALHDNGSNSFLFVNATNIYQFKAKSSEIKVYTLRLGNVSIDFTTMIWKKKELKGDEKFFSVDSNPIDSNVILDSHKYLMQKKLYKIMFGLIRKILIGLLTGLVNGYNHTKCVSLINWWFNLPLLIYVLMIAAKNFTTIHFWLN